MANVLRPLRGLRKYVRNADADECADGSLLDLLHARNGVVIMELLSLLLFLPFIEEEP